MVNLVGLSSRGFQDIYALAFRDVLLGAPWGPLAQSLSLPWHVPCLEAPLAKAHLTLLMECLEEERLPGSGLLGE